MKRFKQFLEENLIRQSLLEYRPPNPPEQYFPNIDGNPLTPNPPIYELPGGIGLWYGPNRPRPTIERSPFFIYDENGNIIGTDLNGDGEPDTDEQLQEWIEAGGLENIPSDWIGDQGSLGARFLLFLRAWWEIAQWVIPAGRIPRTITGITRLLTLALQNGILVFDILTFTQLVDFLVNNPDILPELYELLQLLVQESGPLWETLLQLLQQQWENITNPSTTIPKQFYRIAGNGMLQLWRFNPNTGTWEPFGEPISVEDYTNMCQSGNCPPIQGIGNEIPFYPPLPRPIRPLTVDPNYLEPIDDTLPPVYPGQNWTNQHWNQQPPGGGSGTRTPPPNPEIWQL